MFQKGPYIFEIFGPGSPKYMDQGEKGGSKLS